MLVQSSISDRLGIAGVGIYAYLGIDKFNMESKLTITRE